MDIDALAADLLRDEDEVLSAYPDSLGYLTIGVGRLIDARRGGGISHAESMLLLTNDIDRLRRELADRIAGWDALDGVRQRALANMAFQMGVSGVLGFRHMLANIRARDWQAASASALNSRWARQTPARAARVAHMILSGVAS